MADPEAIFPDYGSWTPSVTGAEVIALMQKETMLGRLPTLADVGNAAAFMASDRASAMTATAANLTGGLVPDR
jgi:enoyl-[acyl-carrier-protein] reductase (NADH)